MFLHDLPVPLTVSLATLFGLLVGSFLNVVIYRVPIMMERYWNVFAKQYLELPLSEEEQRSFNLIKPNSCCPKCGKPVKPWQNIPLLSYMLLGGKCAACQMPISKRYPLVELLTGLLFAVVAWRYGWSIVTFGGLILTAILLALSFIDADTQYLPDQLTIPLIWLGLLFNLNNTFVSLPSAVLGAVCGYMSLWLLYYVYKLLTGKDGMGMGDFKLLSALGAWLGVGALPILVFLASLIGIITALLLRVARGQQFAFGPSLAVAGWLVFVANDEVMAAVDWWLGISGL